MNGCKLLVDSSSESEELKKMMEETGIGQSDLASNIGISKKTMRIVIAGGKVSESTIERIRAFVSDNVAEEEPKRDPSDTFRRFGDSFFFVYGKDEWNLTEEEKSNVDKAHLMLVRGSQYFCKGRYFVSSGKTIKFKKEDEE